MSFKPRFSQPFSIPEAIGLDVSVLTEEIARLQLSLQKLRETQDLLREYLQTEEDAEISKAVAENDVTIASQEERIEMLKIALREKGVLYNAHYDLPTPSKPPNENAALPPAPAPQPDDDGGLHL